MTKAKKEWYLYSFLAFALTYIALCILFPQYIFDPNNETFSSNGDLLVTLYDMIYHVRYDDSSLFTGMNYPVGEYIYMTDANGSFATLFRFIDRNIISIDEYLPGILLSIIYICIAIGGMFNFMILKSSGVRTFIALLFAPIIILFSPQMFRIACHLSLSYPMLIPMSILWAMRKYKNSKLEFWDFAYFLITFFFFMNNAYVGFIMCMLTGLIGGFIVLFDAKKRKSGFIIIAMSVVLIITTYLVLKLNDPYDDRLKLQWGFFYYNTKLHSLYMPSYSWMASLFPEISKKLNTTIERTNNLGVVPILLFTSYLVGLVWSKVRKKKFMQISKWQGALFGAAFVMFLYASNSELFPWIKDVIENNAPILMMFKSSGRFSWALYFVFAYFSVAILDYWCGAFKGNLGLLLIIPLALFWGYETHFALDKRFTKNRDNYLTTPRTIPYQKAMDSLDINNERYQAMYVLPLFQGWNEKIRAGVYNRSEKGALLTSSLTGIPMLNGRLSRNSTGRTLKSVQISSHPLIYKDLLDELPDKRPILLVEGVDAGDRLSIGEKLMKSKAQEIVRFDKFILYSISVDALKEYNEISKARNYLSSLKASDSIPRNALVHYSFEDLKNERAFYGDGCYSLEKGDHIILKDTIEMPREDTLIISSWVLIENEKYGMPTYFFKFKGYSGQKKKSTASREHVDIVGNWIRTETEVTLPKGKIEVELKVRSNQTFLMDELYASIKGDTVITNIEEKKWLLNNYPIDLE